MNTTGQSGMRLAKFLDSMIQRPKYHRRVSVPYSATAKEIRDCFHSCFHDFQKINRA